MTTVDDRMPTKASANRHLHSCSGCFQLERLPGGTCTHWKAPPLHGAHPLRTSFDLGQQEQRDALLPSGIRIALRRGCNTIDLLSVVAREVAR